MWEQDFHTSLMQMRNEQDRRTEWMLWNYKVHIATIGVMLQRKQHHVWTGYLLLKWILPHAWQWSICISLTEIRIFWAGGNSFTRYWDHGNTVDFYKPHLLSITGLSILCWNAKDVTTIIMCDWIGLYASIWHISKPEKLSRLCLHIYTGTKKFEPEQIMALLSLYSPIFVETFANEWTISVGIYEYSKSVFISRHTLKIFYLYWYIHCVIWY